MKYPKSWKNHSDQLDLLMERGLIVTDRVRALDYLERIGYYRLSGYWFAFRERSQPACLLEKYGHKPKKVRVDRIALDNFLPHSTFQNAVDLYVFDKQLRLLVLDALERIEIALRAEVAHKLGELDPFAYLKPELFYKGFSVELNKKTGVTEHHEWLSKHARLIGRSKEEFIRHNRYKYGLPLPIWVASEVWDFGALSTLFSGMHEADQDAIATRYGVSNGRVFATWLRSLNYLRNVCAHHSRLWNRNIVDQPQLPSAEDLEWLAPFVSNEHKRARCFLLLKIAKHVLAVVNPRSSWPQRVQEHLMAFPDLSHLGLNLESMGAPVNWVESWQK
ncbi:Abi family protein [uncultured Paenalcaligenes sp.]|uniref:Abi family protein n=1 Tax=uncultured Paenalcaligenes sp. TaxID=1588925 RepID=UPI002606CE2B|nr:Abi family protein [uncultured Paenalcaligenes sp.]